VTRDIEDLVPRLDQVRGLARSLVRDAAAADDLVQEAVVAALGRGAAEPVGVGWLRAAVRSLAVDRARSEKARLRRERSVASRESAPDSSEHVERAERSRDLVDAVVGLEEPNRTAVILRHLEGLPPREIARRTGASVPTVKKRIERGLVALRERLESRYGGEGQWAVALLPVAGRDVLSGLGATAASGGAAAGGGAAGGGAALAGAGGGSRLPALALGLAIAAAGGAAWVLARTGAGEGAAGEADAARVAAIDASATARAATPPTEERSPALAVDAPDHGADAANTTGSPKPAALVPERIDVHLVDLDGAPLAGLEVAWPEGPGGLPPFGGARPARLVGGAPGEAPPAAPARSADTTLGTATADAAGVAAVPRVALDALRATDGARVRLVHGADARADREVVVFAPAVDLAGLCVGPDGTPVAGAEVEIAARIEAVPGFPIELGATGRLGFWTTAADAEGRFALEGVPTHPAFELRARRPGEDLDVALAVPAASDPMLRIELGAPRPERPRLRVFGRVYGSDGAPRPGAVVKLGGVPARTDAVGRYEIDLDRWPRGCALVASDGDGAFVGGPVPEESRARSADGAGPYDLTLPAEMPRLAGVVVDPEGRPLDGLRVHLVDATRDGNSSRMYEEARGEDSLGVAADTGADGTFEFPRVAPRPYSLRIVDPRAFVSHDVEGIDPRAGEARIVFPGAAAAPPLEGRVVDAFGAPAVGVEVSLSIATLYLPGGGHSSTVGPTAVTDGEGRFRFERAPRAGASFAVRQPGDPAGQSLETLELAGAGESVDLEVALLCGVEIRGPTSSVSSSSAPTASASGRSPSGRAS